jgi:hypothetical protein
MHRTASITPPHLQSPTRVTRGRRKRENETSPPASNQRKRRAERPAGMVAGKRTRTSPLLETATATMSTTTAAARNSTDVTQQSPATTLPQTSTRTTRRARRMLLLSPAHLRTFTSSEIVSRSRVHGLSTSRFTQLIANPRRVSARIATSRATVESNSRHVDLARDTQARLPGQPLPTPGTSTISRTISSESVPTSNVSVVTTRSDSNTPALTTPALTTAVTTAATSPQPNAPPQAQQQQQQQQQQLQQLAQPLTRQRLRVQQQAAAVARAQRQQQQHEQLELLISRSASNRRGNARKSPAMRVRVPR